MIGFRNPPLDAGCSMFMVNGTVSGDIVLFFRGKLVALLRLEKVIKLLFVGLHIRLFSNLI